MRGGWWIVACVCGCLRVWDYVVEYGAYEEDERTEKGSGKFGNSTAVKALEIYN